jgi:hypothetical protein
MTCPSLRCHLELVLLQIDIDVCGCTAQGTTITLLVKLEPSLFVATFALWASFYLVKLLFVADAI